MNSRTALVVLAVALAIAVPVALWLANELKDKPPTPAQQRSLDYGRETMGPIAAHLHLVGETVLTACDSAWESLNNPQWQNQPNPWLGGAVPPSTVGIDKHTAMSSCSGEVVKRDAP